MSGEALYERYKDALKRGHVASLRGRLEEALTAYAEAAAIAPERSTPHASAGTALMRRKRPADALRHYSAALALAPRDETAMLGRAQALAALDRRPEAADAFDALAEIRASSGRLADAVDAARRGLELAEGRERRRTLERLIERLRAASPSEPSRVALERALRVLDGPAVAALQAVAQAPEAVAAVPPAEPDAEAPADAAEPVRAPLPEPDPEAAAEPEFEAAAEPAPDMDAEPQPVDEPEAEAAPPAPVRAALDRDVPDDADSAALTLAAEEAAIARAPDALDRLLDLAAIERREGRIDAALDACYVALSLDPDDVGLHLALVELFDDRGWAVLAVDKLDLLDRIAVLDGDEGSRARVAAARSARG
jgi:tetratricopeptide (TPR) repeat protein